ncbi:MAG: hypothetical protein H8E79_05640 [Desulfobulbaceae bacterium]|uniref:Cytoplasmic protein n=1 Tax=Candidatus Desulfatifera sulfidica TaxID=2841691 RepID=A0A8J6NBB5_9BACT|nr:hypothetical protein [Candidatus Desulfatifera sulfidica]
MGKEDLVVNNPLRVLGMGTKAEDEQQRMGLIMARAGLGKTAILVQIALDSILRGNKVLHVSIGEGVEKTRAWYDDILNLMVEGKDFDNLPEMVSEIVSKRMIMTFKESSFGAAKLEERLKDMVQQDIFCPDCMIIDGYDFGETTHEQLQEFKAFMITHGLKTIWFSAVSHRGDDRVSEAGVPAPCHEIDDLFEMIMMIVPEQDAIKLNLLKCTSGAVEPGTSLLLDPSTMLIKKG